MPCWRRRAGPFAGAAGCAACPSVPAGLARAAAQPASPASPPPCAAAVAVIDSPDSSVLIGSLSISDLRGLGPSLSERLAEPVGEFLRGGGWCGGRAGGRQNGSPRGGVAAGESGGPRTAAVQGFCKGDSLKVAQNGHAAEGDARAGRSVRSHASPTHTLRACPCPLPLSLPAEFGVRSPESLPHGAPPPVCCTLGATFGEVLSSLATQRLHRLFVVDGEGRAVGVVSITDLLRFIAGS